MSQKKALKIVAILFSISLIVLIVTGILKKAFPEKFDNSLREQEIKNAVEEERQADELPINEMAMSGTMKNNRNVWSWPYDSTVPIYHNVDLNIYQNRIKDDTALEGITVYLSATPVSGKLSLNEEGGVNDPSAHGTDSDRQEENPSVSAANADPSENSEEDQDQSAEEEDKFLLNASSISDQELNKILANILTYTKTGLEGIGAKVIIIDPDYQTDIEKAAFVGKNILLDFQNELEDQKFKCDRLNGLLDPLTAIQNNTADTQTKNKLFPQVGVSPEQRLLLDVERQYNDQVFVNLKFGDTDREINGSAVHFLGNQSASIGAQSDTITDDQTEMPAYIAYDTEERQRFAQLMAKNISQLMPGLSYTGDDPVHESVITSLRLINLTSLEIEVGQRRQDFDIQILSSEEQQKVFAEAVNNAVYELYCTELK